MMLAFMSDAGIAAITTGLVTIATMVIGFFTLWVRLKYDVEKAKKAAEEAAINTKVVENKIDLNTQITDKGNKDAARTASEVKSALNGGLKERMTSIINEAIAPMVNQITMNTERIERHSISNKAHIETLQSKILELQNQIMLSEDRKHR